MAQTTKRTKSAVRQGPKIHSSTRTPKKKVGQDQAVYLSEALAEVLSESGALEARLDFQGHSIRIRRSTGNIPLSNSINRSTDMVLNDSGEDHEAVDDFITPVTSHHVGTFRSTHAKTKQSMVKKGDTIELNQCLGWIEMMGMRHDVLASRAGTVAEILVTDGDPIEYGQVLLLIQ